MSNVVILDNVEHQDVKVSIERGAAFGDHVNQVLVFPNEFRELQREYPILFRRDAQGAFQAIALLGFDRDENLFLKGGAWNARYLPAIQARGPFSLAVVKPEEGASEVNVKVRIDLDNPAVGQDSGYPLFLPHGGNAPYLEAILSVLEKLHSGVEISKSFFAVLEELQLIEPITLDIKVDDARQYNIPGVFSISEERLNNLTARQLEKLHKTGMLAPCYWALSSLDNIRHLVDLKNRAEAG